MTSSSGSTRSTTEGLAKGRAEGLAKGRTEGLAKGRTEGLAKGRAEGLAKAVLSVIETRGLTLPEPLRQRIASCTDEAILHRWLRRACVSTSMQDLLDDAPF